MKIAITAHGQDREAQVDSRFGRADYFVLYDQEKDTWDCLPNTQNLEAAHGAGIQAGQFLLKTGAKVLITGHVGPKAFKVLDAGEVKMYSFGDMNGDVKDALAAFLAGKLATVTVPNALDVKR
ncbi:dinitrogenase iron-molybdenum cofactor biosynthesis [Lucifera butyrica]|uniref:Dinitrogenase iron-molybdenum cofactor biosynthesis n=1 Tax=Lucifera butyrica TaxID=1351585 RepID=A0A498RBS7_9FIRM|nr:NifB/NifX family molybdenum-iron cluster-binding protein [Lucifera butyrica]VBB08367.1 dinitrogenase iron-molybdenum cofactor biosynthesis [Lucifera butyrica]